MKPQFLEQSFYGSSLQMHEVKSRIKPEEMQLIRTVSGMANNLNPIAHRLNAFGISALNEELNALKQLIHELMKRLKP